LSSSAGWLLSTSWLRSWIFQIEISRKFFKFFFFSNEKSLIVMLALEENEHLNIAANNASYSEDDLVSRKSDGRAERREKEMSW
jgi:hypothetical protein